MQANVSPRVIRRCEREADVTDFAASVNADVLSRLSCVFWEEGAKQFSTSRS
ncbi:hypothetical protein RSSM_05227 [Rhodopirellula sallentina SM41]|uniref:Uncharacterized protein n=1 Tax=Rhodopirellula sallentina SM41 TaxID=1263870 RepID=M5TVU8_9BACT|nr:hypothetical protein RSSM_05227 [Rhodopirellula sallentina SM41]